MHFTISTHAQQYMWKMPENVSNDDTINISQRIGMKGKKPFCDGWEKFIEIYGINPVAAKKN